MKADLIAIVISNILMAPALWLVWGHIGIGCMVLADLAVLWVGRWSRRVVASRQRL